ncbi:MAG: MFS transporter [Chthoniobacteraceae bacterium]|nr:MFS transporter [Chthoniobacteraceae bacterium]
MKTDPFPPGVTNANWFSFYNAISFQIFLGPPVVLYAKSLGASATLLGILASFTPLLAIFQIPAARFLPRFGYRRFILAGWGTRNICVFTVVAVPLLGFLGTGWRLALLFLLAFIFNFLRGVTSGAWLPWMTEILPETIRARFLSRDQRFMQLGSLVALFFCGFVLQRESRPWEFSAVFLISAIGGAVSLYYINRVPDVKAPEKLKRSGTRVPWREIVTYPPFARVVIFNVVTSIAYGSLEVFTVAFLKMHTGLGENRILFLTGTSFVAGVAALGTIGWLLDAFGSKRLLSWGLALHACFLCGWLALASGLFPVGTLVVLAIFALSGTATAAIGLANLRLIMGVMPEMGRNHFFAFYSMITSLCLGFGPILWGVCLDATEGFHFRMAGGFEWNRFSVYYAALLVLTALAAVAAARLMEGGPGLVKRAEAPVRADLNPGSRGQ